MSTESDRWSLRDAAKPALVTFLTHARRSPLIRIPFVICERHWPRGKKQVERNAAVLRDGWMGWDERRDLGGEVEWMI